ncbi:MAG: phosphate ABC transporter permease subunit PstC [Erysipelothrix sp.]|nr:phosphate ABC transporter permease subunit PstC [Erysipelothrix sp.]
MQSIMKYAFIVAASFSIISIILIFYFLVVNGLPAIIEIGFIEFMFGTKWTPGNVPPSFGIFPMILGSIYVTAYSILIAAPVGIGAAIYITFESSKKVKEPIKTLINLLAGIPSVVYGFFGLVVIVPLVRNIDGNGNSILSASILLGLMILPTIISMSHNAMENVDKVLYDSAIALGATHEQAVYKVMVPAAKSGVMASLVLGIGRAIGETMAVIMVIGNQAIIRLPFDIFKGVRTLTGNIVIEMGYAAGLHRSALISTGLVLFVFIILVNSLFNVINKGTNK